MTQETIHLFWIFFWLILINVFLFIIWAVMDMSGRISREEERRDIEEETRS